MYYYSMQKETVSKYIHVMKYMGSKRELLEQIGEIITKTIPKDKVLLDIFAGTCGVGIYLRDRYPVYSNDIQLYSKFISKGTIEAEPIDITKSQVWNLLAQNYEKNFQFITSRLSNLLKKSNEFKQKQEWDDVLLAQYLRFIETVPSPLNISRSDPEHAWITGEYTKQSAEGRTFPYVQTTFLFSEMYFGMEQAIAIDSLKYAIDSLPPERNNLSQILHTALIHSYSYNSAGTGHFAQFRDLSTLSSVTDVFSYRKRSVLDYFFRKAEEIIDAVKTNRHHEKSGSFSCDYRTLLDDQSIMEKVGLVYADPPYTFVHYSRFYHAVENLCRYDYPIVEYKGRYRADRHQSPFCIKTSVPKAFQEIFIKTAKYKIPVLISYSNTGMIELKDIRQIAKEHGYKLSLLEVEHKHSTMGRLKDKNRDVKEALLLCY